MIVEDELLVGTADGFHEWLCDPLTRKGSRCCYHIGHLAADKRHNEDLRALATAALGAAGYTWGENQSGQYTTNYKARNDRVHLVQRRFDSKSFEYLAVRK